MDRRSGIKAALKSQKSALLGSHSQGVVLSHQRCGDGIRRAVAREWGHDDAVGKMQITRLVWGEKGDVGGGHGFSTRVQGGSWSV